MPDLKYSDSSKLIIEALALASHRAGMKPGNPFKSRPLNVPTEDELIAQDKVAMDLFDLEEITEFFSFGNDDGIGALTIRPKPDLLLYHDKDIQEIIRILKLAFDQFKISLENKGVPVENFTVTRNKDELIVCKAFIKELIGKNLLPKAYAPNLEHGNQPAYMTPFTTTPVPSPRNKSAEENDEQILVEDKDLEHDSGIDSVFNPSPFPQLKLFSGCS
ncbi:hypothetical protein OQJ18_00240 [Fluoribacter dumoffii]|uniref:Uncharacterized protein n=1 Tax=Fluoribacter dumoffii TaxID=463 RepID=A0A377GC72_9GAMM|nr:hypothetical protein [Fluoribacter dumoffii]KTC90723.1 hypothetical protein Ldum_1791 [Fluoribacter dumoffii NY 23]MCW8386403.1 hypothetical protein [Fluoribacter dumoffii]MCW8419456.1 hypothetical protein [Fluoribacter dumoffii]MCW8452669.1 hypothetical protein [Fluoribacter dumoffii]MCW8460081.1 hypothetical protein [Fluoribacter dumoffii]